VAGPSGALVPAVCGAADVAGACVVADGWTVAQPAATSEAKTIAEIRNWWITEGIENPVKVVEQCSANGRCSLRLSGM
jgi:hypothetical protein